MKRFLALLIVPVLFVACGGKSKGAKVSGLVHDPDGTSIPQAMVSIEGAASQQTANNGTFALETGTGMHRVGVAAAGFYPLTTNVDLLPGMNTLDLILQPCDPADTSCTMATPTPTVTPTPLPTPPPGANLFATFDGVNYPGSGNPPNWNGTAFDNRNTTVWGNGGNNYAITECYKDAGDTIPLSGSDTSAMIDHCWIDWVIGFGAIHNGYQDSVVELWLPGDSWRMVADNPGTVFRCSVELGTCRFTYDEISSGGAFQEFNAAVDGVADLEKAGFLGNQPVTVSNGAFTGLDFP